MVAEETLSAIADINVALEGQPYKAAVVSVDALELLEKNARFMRNETFRNLVENIKRDGGLSSVPFCLKLGDRYRVLSGNHRVQAAQEAGVKRLLVLYTDRELSREEQVSVQLSHNAIVGEDDPVILKELWDELEDISLKFYAGFDDKLLGELEGTSLDSLSEVKLDFRSFTFLFLPEETERLDEVFAKARQSVPLKDGRLARLAEFDRLMDALAKTQAAHNVKNVAVALMLVLEAFERHLTDLSEGWLDEEGELKHKSWVPLASVLGTDTIPPESARVVKQAVDTMMSRDDVSSKARWQALEFWAADYLAGS